MKGVVSEARRRSARVHARRAHYCDCGRVVFGNGGYTSHQRANPDHRYTFAPGLHVTPQREVERYREEHKR